MPTVGDESGVPAGGYAAPSEYELWRDALMITATAMRRESYPDKASLRTLAWETRDLLREETAGRVGFDVQYRELHVEWRSLLDQVAAALAIHHPCHTAGPADGGRAADCERSHQYRSEQAECIGCGYGSTDEPTGWPCVTAQALGESG